MKNVLEMIKKCRKLHFVGIGGVSMSSLAAIAKKRGYEVTGSDDDLNNTTIEYLETLGIKIAAPLGAGNISEEIELVIRTAAVHMDNPEIKRALELGIPVITRAEYLGYIMTEYRERIGISGTHGKSTTTGMIHSLYDDAGKDPTTICGAVMSGGRAYTLGSDEKFIYEACEYTDSFLHFNPTTALILNIELDHVDYFHSIEQVRRSFAEYASLTGDEGYVVANADDDNVMLSLKNYGGTAVSFGVDSENADIRAVDIVCRGGRYSFDIEKRGKLLCRVELSVTGYHNIYNALACAAAADLCGIGAEDIAAGLAAFRGAKRRMEYKGKVGGADIYDDYGHHPTEISTTLAGARGLAEARLVCVYQPHTYSRTKALFDDFARAFGAADRVIFSDIYAAREIDDGSVSSKMLAEAVGENAVWGGDLKRTAELLRSELKEGDTAIIMGAGDIWKLFDMIIQGETF